ncbi:hypothetical protein CDAR_438541 [Caerostris darwini]|uniref:Uncharacterized protein n=1 Tax=Caerostris darwini TaxID=1538125 RepID=A0AAV4X2J5_9ARAC|nr:hypothetical protein CDAR_438541 [Caerostris darwini]
MALLVWRHDNRIHFRNQKHKNPQKKSSDDSSNLSGDPGRRSPPSPLEAHIPPPPEDPRREVRKRSPSGRNRFLGKPRVNGVRSVVGDLRNRLLRRWPWMMNESPD